MPLDTKGLGAIQEFTVLCPPHYDGARPCGQRVLALSETQSSWSTVILQLALTINRMQS